MSTNAADYYRDNAAAMKPVRTEMGETLKAFGGLHHATMQEGELDVKTKELMALAIGLAVRCENCIYAHAKAAIQAGATPAQLREAASVAVMMGGGPVYTYLPRIEEAIVELT